MSIGGWTWLRGISKRLNMLIGYLSDIVIQVLCAILDNASHTWMTTLEATVAI